MPPLRELMTPRVRRVLRITGYVAFYAFALIVFGTLSFPYQRLRDRIVQEFNQQQTGPDAMRLEIDQLDAYWLSGVEAEGVRLVSMPTASVASATSGQRPLPRVMTIDSAHVRVGILGLLFGSTRVSFGARAFGGKIYGNTSEREGARQLELELEELSLSEAPVLADAVGLPLKGTMDGSLELLLPEGKLAKADGTIKLTVSELSVGDGKAKLRDALALPRIDAGELVFEGEISAGQLKIDKFSGTGQHLEFASEGGARLRDPVTMSLLNLTARFRFTERYTNQNEITRGLFGAPGSSMPGLFDLDPKNKRAKRPDGFYGWRASGTLAAPTFIPNPNPGPNPAVPGRPGVAGQ